MNWGSIITLWNAVLSWNWGAFIGSAVIATAISSLVAWLTTLRRFAVDRELAERKIAADIDLAERKFEFDKKLAEHKINLDAALAEKKFTFDKNVVVWRRRFGIAEQVLAAVVQLRAHRCGTSHEGRGRIHAEPSPLGTASRERRQGSCDAVPP